MHRGRVSLKIGNNTYAVKYDWDALAQLREMFGAEYTNEIYKAVDSEDVAALAEITSISIGGQLSAEEIRKISPSLIPIVEAIRTGVNVAYYGAVEPLNPPRAVRITNLLKWMTSFLPRSQPHTPEV